MNGNKAGLKDGYAFISGDSHLEVLPERWTNRVPAKHRHLMPHTVEHPDGGDALQIEGIPLQRVNYIDLRGGRSAEDWQPFGVKVEDTAGVGPPEQRLREQDQDGCAAEVLYPNMVVGPRLWASIPDRDAYTAAVHAYNGWLAEEYCSVDPRRLIGLGVIPWSTVDDAIAELEYCAAAGLKGVLLGAYPNGSACPLPEDDRFWAVALDMKMPLTIHVSMDRTGPRASHPTFRYPNEDPEVLSKMGRGLVDWLAFHGMPPGMTFSQMILSGVFDRFPALRIFFAETRLGWVPHWMEEADFWYERHRHWSERYLGVKPLPRMPSDYVREQFWFSVQAPETVALELRHRIGLDHIIFATDFPHIECEWPNSVPALERFTEPLSDDERHLLVAQNVLDFFGLPAEDYLAG